MTADPYLYDVLGVKPEASLKEIKNAYYNKSYEVDENDNGNFNELLSTAYYILSDNRLREEYDNNGMQVIDQVADSTFNYSFSDLNLSHSPSRNSSFIGMNHSRNHHCSPSKLFMRENKHKSPKKQRRAIQTFQLKLSLKKLYNGCTIPLTVEIEQQCRKCKGSGLASPIKAKCKTCNGSGIVYISSDPFGNSKVTPRKCPDCYGKGIFIQKMKGTCKECLGYGIEKIKTNINVVIKPGTANGDIISVEDYDDIKIVILQKKNSKFIRKENDLYMRKTITISQAICGFSFPIKHLDGRILIAKSDSQKPIKPGMKLVIENEGFPTYDDPQIKGNLYITFDIAFPKESDIDQRFKQLLANASPQKNLPTIDNVVILNDSSIEEFGKKTHNASSFSEYYSDDYLEEEEEDYF